MHITVISGAVGYGEIGINGELGYHGAKVCGSIPAGMQIISAHAPSRIEVDVDCDFTVEAAQNGLKDSAVPTSCFVDGKEIGTVQNRWETTDGITLSAGRHVFVFATQRNRNSQTLWRFTEAKKDVQADANIEAADEIDEIIETENKEEDDVCEFKSED